MSATLSSNMSLLDRGSLRREEDILNAFEYEEERITNRLVSKLEQVNSLFSPNAPAFRALRPFYQLRKEKVQLENSLEAEGEAHVNRLTREIAALRQAQEDALESHGGPSSSSSSAFTPPATHPPDSPASLVRMQTMTPIQVSPPEPSANTIFDALRRENDSLRRRV